MTDSSEKNTNTETQIEHETKNVPESKGAEDSEPKDTSNKSDDVKKYDSSKDKSDATNFGWKPDERGSRDPRDMSFEEKLRSFKKQSEERLLHIKRSREAKISKKKTR